MFGCHVMNQSVENGSMPFGGDAPFSSLYSLIRRSRDRLVSASSNCRRAPSSISSIASVISRTSDTTLRVAMRHAFLAVAGAGLVTEISPGGGPLGGTPLGGTPLFG